MLQMQMANTEKDTLDVISYLKQEDGKKDEQVTSDSLTFCFLQTVYQRHCYCQ